VFSLEDLQLGGVIDKGCNAVVYAARWKDEGWMLTYYYTTIIISH